MTGRRPLLARTRRIDRDVDLLTVAGPDGVLFERNRAGLAGRGVAARLPLSALTEGLDRIRVDDDVDRPGTGPVAFGALPFRDDPTAELIVPRLCVGKDPDGTRWLTTVGYADEPEPELTAAADDVGPATATPSRYHVSAVRPPADWCAAVAAATDRIRTGELDKVVLAREILVEADAELPVTDVLARLRDRFGGCYVFLVDGFCGASPELLVSRSGDLVRSQPMAGTAPRRGDPVADERAAAALLASPTYRHEHQVTIDAVHETLLAFCSYLDYEPEPSVVNLANVVHLATTVQGRLSHPPATALELRAALHPTPAVCGRPREVARQVIAELEGTDRGRYAGSVGWVDRHGNGTWAVSVRCAQLDGRTARLHGGGGIVATSEPRTELAETRAKLQAMLSALVRP